jgi:type 1 glutamine amidotransferase
MFASLLVAAATTLAPAADPAPKRVLLVTHSGGFIHDSVGVAEDVLKEIGPKNGLAVTCFRYTGDPSDPKFKKYQEDFRARTGKTVEPQSCGRITADTLKNYDLVHFFTTGDPLTKGELADFQAWVKAGGAFTGTHCATDTLYGEQGYGELIGAYFTGHPSGLQKVRVKVDDPGHPAAAPFAGGGEYQDEMYVFASKGRPFQAQPYSRDKVNVILSCEKGSLESNFKGWKGDTRADGDYAISWSKQVGNGQVFYTSFGHQKKVWQDPKFQQHLLAGMKWALTKPAE